MPAKILIVEDESITAEDLRDILTDMGYLVTAAAASGKDAIARAQLEMPDLALMDIHLKGAMDGTETARILRERFDIPVIYLTAHADRETLDRAKIAVPLGYVTKPFRHPDLRASIEMALFKHHEDAKNKQREHILTSTLQAIGVGILSVDRRAAVTLLNPAAEGWTAWTAKEAVGKSFGEVFPLVDARSGLRIELPVGAVFGGGKLLELRDEILLLARNGTKRPIEGTVAPVLDHQNAVSGAVIVFGHGPGRAKSTLAPAAELARVDGERLDFGNFRMVAASQAMRQVVRFARRVAESEASTILLEGETGTGKDVMAHFIHHFGTRRDRPFVALNCAAIPENLIESELFGYEKGAFTDAKGQKPGILELATTGTVFLDEIGEMPIQIQAKMLRVLEERKFRRLGGLKDIQVDLRVVAASNRKLADAVDQGKFRIDLYYRLNIIQVSLPPLRQRKDDIIPLADFFIQHYNERFKRNIRGISPEAARSLLAYSWPGNIRELRNTIERAVLLEETDWLQPSSAQFGTTPPAQKTSRPPEAGAPSALEATERRMVIEALEQCAWNQTRAAAALGVSRDVMRYKIKKFNLQKTSTDLDKEN